MKMEKPIKLDEFYYHEALDRAHIVHEHFCEHVESHPVIQQEEELKLAARKLSAELYKFYCVVSKYRKDCVLHKP